MGEVNRKLASIQKIEEIRPIEKADNIEVARVLGWDVVVTKGKHQVNDLVCFFEIDSFLPLSDPRYSFLSKNAIKWNGLQGMRLRTVKLRKQISQGLVLPLSDFPELAVNISDTVLNVAIDMSINKTPAEEWPWRYNELVSLELIQDLKCIAGLDIYEEFPIIVKDAIDTNSPSLIGFDLTKILGIEKWEAPVPANLAGQRKGTFPHFVPKTDEERIQNIFKDVKRRVDDLYEVTTKLDGSSMTAYLLEDNQFGVCSRNWDLAETEDNSFWKAARACNLKEAMVSMKMALGATRIAVQGELIGPGIQHNYEALSELGFYVFNIYNIDKQEYVDPDTRRLLVQTVGLNHAPLVDSAKAFDFETVEQAVNYADGWSLNPKVRREGVVWKSLTDPRFSFKIISNRYLLEEK